MIEPINARLLVNNGWTIQNRRKLEGIIGEQECRNLFCTYQRIEKNNNSIPSLIGNFDKLVMMPYCAKLINFGNSLRLKLDVFLDDFRSPFERPKTLENDDINLDNINKVLLKYEKEVSQSYPDSLIKSGAVSETMNLLYTDKYKPTRRLTEEGFPVTTVIDRKTEEPVEAYFKNIKNHNGEEKWYLFTKDIDGKEKEIGYRSFQTTIPSKISAGFMESEFNNEYRGVGLRLHQVTVERMIQMNKDKIILESESRAFPFHYKSGFRMNDAPVSMSKDSLDSYIAVWSDIIGMEKDLLKKYVITEEQANNLYVFNKTEEFFRMLAYINKSKENSMPTEYVPMELSGEFLETWKELAKSQPILL